MMRTSRIVVTIDRDISWGFADESSIGEAASAEGVLFTLRTMGSPFLPVGIVICVKLCVEDLYLERDERILLR